MATISPIALPLAKEKKEKKIFRVIKKAKESKKIFRGVKATHRMLRKGKKGIIVLAANTSPIDIISHFPAMCQEKEIPWVFVRDSINLGESYGTRVPIICLMVEEAEKTDKYYKVYTKMLKYVKEMDQEVESFF